MAFLGSGTPVPPRLQGGHGWAGRRESCGDGSRRDWRAGVWHRRRGRRKACFGRRYGRWRDRGRHRRRGRNHRDRGRGRERRDQRRPGRDPRSRRHCRNGWHRRSRGNSRGGRDRTDRRHPCVGWHSRQRRYGQPSPHGRLARHGRWYRGRWDRGDSSLDLRRSWWAIRSERVRIRLQRPWQLPRRCVLPQQSALPGDLRRQWLPSGR